MKCWNCGAAQTEQIGGKVSFRAECTHCQAWLHCCKNCRHYSPGKPNHCTIPGTEPISDREKANHCDDFLLAGESEKKDSLENVRSRFDSLFREEQT